MIVVIVVPGFLYVEILSSCVIISRRNNKGQLLSLGKKFL